MRIFSLLLLFFNGISAIAGASSLITDPTGKNIGLPLAILDDSPFNDFLIPGIILLVFNGFSSLLIAWLVIKKHSYYPSLVIVQGFILLIWIITQLNMIHGISWLHFLYGGIGVLMIITGARMHNFLKQYSKP